jgi:hypothetical protein
MAKFGTRTLTVKIVWFRNTAYRESHANSPLNPTPNQAAYLTTLAKECSVLDI